MGRGRRWGMFGGLLLALATLGGLARGDLTALFPSALYVYVQPADLIRAKDFNPVAKEVEAIERTLGAELANVPSAYAPCLRLETEDLVQGKIFDGLWRAPKAGRVVAVSCDLRGPNASLVYDVATASASVGALSVCGTTLTSTTTTGVAMAAGATLDVTINQVSGLIERATICWTFQPGA